MYMNMFKKNKLNLLFSTCLFALINNAYADSFNSGMSAISTTTSDANTMITLINDSPQDRETWADKYALTYIKGNWSKAASYSLKRDTYTNLIDVNEEHGTGFGEFNYDSGAGDADAAAADAGDLQTAVGAAGLVKQGLSLVETILKNYAPCAQYGDVTNTPILIQNHTNKDIKILYQANTDIQTAGTYPGTLTSQAKCGEPNNGIGSGQIFIQSTDTALTFMQAGGAYVTGNGAGAALGMGETQVLQCQENSTDDCKLTFTLDGSNDAPITLRLFESGDPLIHHSSFEFFSANVDEIKNNEHFVLSPCTVTGNLQGKLGVTVANDIKASMSDIKSSSSDTIVKYYQNDAICMAIYPNSPDEAGIADYEQPHFWPAPINNGLFSQKAVLPVYFSGQGDPSTDPFYNDLDTGRPLRPADTPRPYYDGSMDDVLQSNQDTKYFGEITGIGHPESFKHTIDYSDFDMQLAIAANWQHTALRSAIYLDDTSLLRDDGWVSQLSKSDREHIKLRVYFNPSNPAELPFTVDLMKLTKSELINDIIYIDRYTPLRWSNMSIRWVSEEDYEKGIISATEWAQAQPLSRYGQIYAVTDPVAANSDSSSIIEMSVGDTTVGTRHRTYRSSGAYGKYQKGTSASYTSHYNDDWHYIHDTDTPASYAKLDLEGSTGLKSLFIHGNKYQGDYSPLLTPGYNLAFIYRTHKGDAMLFSTIDSTPNQELANSDIMPVGNLTAFTGSLKYQGGAIKKAGYELDRASMFKSGKYIGYPSGLPTSLLNNDQCIWNYKHDFPNDDNNYICTFTNRFTDIYKSLFNTSSLSEVATTNTNASGDQNHYYLKLNNSITYNYNKNLNKYIGGVPIAKRFTEDQNENVVFLPAGTIFMPDENIYSKVDRSANANDPVADEEKSLSDADFADVFNVESISDQKNNTIDFVFSDTDADIEHLLNGDQDVLFIIKDLESGSNSLRDCQFAYNHKGKLIYGDQNGGWGVDQTIMKPDVNENKVLVKIVCQSQGDHTVGDGVYSANMTAAFKYHNIDILMRSVALLSVGEDNSSIEDTPAFEAGSYTEGNEYRIVVDGLDDNSEDYQGTASLTLTGVKEAGIAQCHVYQKNDVGWQDLGQTMERTFILGDTSKVDNFLTASGEDPDNYGIKIDCSNLDDQSGVHFSMLQTLVQIGDREVESIHLQDKNNYTQNYRKFAEETEIKAFSYSKNNIYGKPASYLISILSVNNPVSNYPNTAKLKINNAVAANMQDCWVEYIDSQEGYFTNIGSTGDGSIDITDTTKVKNWLMPYVSVTSPDWLLDYQQVSVLISHCTANGDGDIHPEKLDAEIILGDDKQIKVNYLGNLASSDLQVNPLDFSVSGSYDSSTQKYSIYVNKDPNNERDNYSGLAQIDISDGGSGELISCDVIIPENLTDQHTDKVNIGKAYHGTFILKNMNNEQKYPYWLADNNDNPSFEIDCGGVGGLLPDSISVGIGLGGMYKTSNIYNYSNDDPTSFLVTSYIGGNGSDYDYRIFVDPIGNNPSDFDSSATLTLTNVTEAKMAGCNVYYNDNITWKHLGLASQGTFVLTNTDNVRNWLIKETDEKMKYAISINCSMVDNYSTLIEPEKLGVQLTIGSKTRSSHYFSGGEANYQDQFQNLYRSNLCPDSGRSWCSN